MRLFLDANVLFTAAYSPAGRSAALFELAGVGRCRLLSSLHALDEARRNLRLKAPEAEERLDRLCEGLELVREAGAELVAWTSGLGLPAYDAPVLAAAVAAKADLLVTGDRRHFGRFFGRTVGAVRVVPPRDALETVLPRRR